MHVHCHRNDISLISIYTHDTEYILYTIAIKYNHKYLNRQAGWGGKELRLTLLVSLGSFWCLLSHVQIKVVGYNMMEAECGRSVIHLYVLVQCGMGEVEFCIS